MEALRGTPSESEYGRVVELVDSLDSGSSVHCGRAGSSPASPTRKSILCLWTEDAFFSEINPFGICEMPDRREILLRNVKCASAREGFVSFHLTQSVKFHNPPGGLFHIRRIFHFLDYVSRYFLRVARPPRMCRSCLFLSSTLRTCTYRG